MACHRLFIAVFRLISNHEDSCHSRRRIDNGTSTFDTENVVMVTFADMAYRHRHGAFVSTKFRGGVEINGPAENAGLKNCCPWDFSTREVWDVALLRAQCLTLSSPVVPNGYTTKCSKPYWSNPPFIFFWRSSTLALRTERQSARTSKKNKWWVRPVWLWTLCSVTIWHHWAWKG